MLDKSKKVYVLDTNILVGYPRIIPGKHGTGQVLDNPSGDLTDAHLVIPSAVIRELSKFKTENTDRGNSAREVLRNVREYAETVTYDMNSNYHLESAIELPGGQLLSILPVHADFKKTLAFRPAEDDMDGQIILAALTCAYLMEHDPDEKVFGSNEMDITDNSKRGNIASSKVVLLTNDNGLAIRARERGIVTSRYSYDLPKPYTGRREVVVPPEIFQEFWDSRTLERDFWEEFLPDEPKLVANEFIVMRREDPKDYPLEMLTEGNPYYKHIGRYDYLKDAIVGLKYTSEAPYAVRSEGQAMYTEALFHPDIALVLCTGPAGSGKTYLPTVYGIHVCQKGQYVDEVVVPCADFGKLGALPGGLDEKMSLDTGPIRNAIRNYLLKDDPHFKTTFDKFRKEGSKFKPGDVKLTNDDDNDDNDTPLSFNDLINNRINLTWRMFFRNLPVEKAQGLDFAYELVHYDEFQDQSPSRADMLVKRLGEGGKIIITGDIKQIHAPYLDEYNNGIVYVARIFYDNPMVARVSLLKEEVERHELVRFIAERQEEKQKTP